MIPQEWILPILQTVIIGLQTLIIALSLDKKIDRKLDKYWRRVRTSPEGQDLFITVKELRKFIQSPELKKLMSEVQETVSDFRVMLKTIRERAEAEEEQEAVVLPRLEET